jgi:tetratricopeptide (TPR) repeat protein
VWHLTHVLSWEPRQTAIHWLVRRAVAYYRLRDFSGALKDLDDAIAISSRRRGRTDIDALRYRALVREMCHDVEGAQADIDEILKHQQKPDPLAYALRASIKASQGLLDGALADIVRIPSAIQSAPRWQSEVASENFDLVYLAAGWAKASVSLVSLVPPCD